MWWMASGGWEGGSTHLPTKSHRYKTVGSTQPHLVWRHQVETGRQPVDQWGRSAWRSWCIRMMNHARSRRKFQKKTCLQKLAAAYGSLTIFKGPKRWELLSCFLSDGTPNTRVLESVPKQEDKQEDGPMSLKKEQAETSFQLCNLFIIIFHPQPYKKHGAHVFTINLNKTIALTLSLVNKIVYRTFVFISLFCFDRYVRHKQVRHLNRKEFLLFFGPKWRDWKEYETIVKTVR